MNRRLNMVQVCFTDAWGGLEMSARDYTRYFLERGHQSFCLCRKGSKLHEMLERDGLPLHAVDFISRYSPLAIIKIRKFLQKKQIDIVHLHTPRDLWMITPATVGLSGLRIFATSRMLFTRTSKRDLLHRMVYSKLDWMINTTAVSQTHMQANLPISPDRHIVIPNPVDLSRFQPELYDRELYRNEWGVDEKTVLLGLVGRIDPTKGQKETIAALPAILARNPDLKLVIIGEITVGHKSDFLQELKSLVKQLGVEQSVIWAGFKSDVPAVLRALDIFIMPSYKESFGKVLIEAMAMKIPVISTNKGGPPEILSQGECGLLVPPCESAPIAEAVLQYLENDQLRRDMIDKGRRKVEDYYSLTSVLERLEKLYYETLTPTQG
jgi:glycosyltransferase involved in cell wall biosynthesis